MSQANSAVAIIGMAGRFPGAGSVSELWSLLKSGKEARCELSDDTLRAAGLSERLIRNPRYVKACMKLDGLDLFDSEFFNFSPRQADNVDPQHRCFLECAWEALEDAGYHPRGYRGAIGVYAGCGVSGYIFERCRSGAEDIYQCLLDADKDFLTTRASYKLGLTGPSVAVQTACSTSLVAVHLGCQSLLNFECDMCLAGGVSINLRPETGYLPVKDGIASFDGHCRPFDADATGTIAGSGLGIVVLKRLQDAIEDRDQIHAVILSTAINNDGSRKVGFTAPGQRAQVEVIATALALAGREPKDIDYIEAHGTGTRLGDAVELSGLLEVFRGRQARERRCALGSIKSNVGHLDAAAGVTGLIKLALCLKHAALVPTVNFVRPNELLDSTDSVFFVNTQTRPWYREPGGSRCGAVSSFGIGGTNAHAILEEAPERPPPASDELERVYPISARTAAALGVMAGNLARSLEADDPLNPRDVAFTLQVGRQLFAHRRFVIGGSAREVARALRAAPGPDSLLEFTDGERPIAWVFSGQGTPCAGVAGSLYEGDGVFRDTLNRCAHLIECQTGRDVRHHLCTPPVEQPANVSVTDAHLALFALQYSLAALWTHWGIKPEAIAGHSLGEYAAACVAGIFSLEQAIELLAVRAAAVEVLPAGEMLAVQLSSAEVKGHLGNRLSLACINGPGQCVVAGPSTDIAELAAHLSGQRVASFRLPVPRAYHSFMMEPAGQAITTAAARVEFRSPKIAMISSVTGRSAADSGMLTPEYWGRQLSSPVRFDAVTEHLTRDARRIYLEVGPGQSLVNVLRAGAGKGALVLPSLAPGAATRRDLIFRLGRIWLHGGSIDWHANPSERAYRVSLPTYPFQRRRHWLQDSDSAEGATTEDAQQTGRRSAGSNFYVRDWCKTLNPAPISTCVVSDEAEWLVFADDAGVARLLLQPMGLAGARVCTVIPGTEFGERNRNEFCLDPSCPEHYQRLFACLRAAGRRTRGIIHCGTIAVTSVDRAGERAGVFGHAAFTSLLSCAQAAQDSCRLAPYPLLIVTNGLWSIAGEAGHAPGKGWLATLPPIVARECAFLACKVIDLPGSQTRPELEQSVTRYAPWIVAEAIAGSPGALIAYRGDHRLVETFHALDLADDYPLRQLRRGGAYLLTGGFGDVGLELARRLARECAPKLILIGTRGLPERSSWDALIADKSCEARLRSVLARLVEIEKAGAAVSAYRADVAQAGEVRAVVDSVLSKGGVINGVFHLAADTRHPSAARPFEALTGADFHRQAYPKLGGLQALNEVFRDHPLDFAVAFSSTAAILGGTGLGAYAAANGSLDASAATCPCGGQRWMTINWDGWAINRERQDDPYSLAAEEGFDALLRVLRHSTIGQIIVSKGLFPDRVARSRQSCRTPEVERRQPVRTEAPPLAVPPRNDLESEIANIWQELLGRSGIGIDETFLDLGGDSLTGLRVMERLREKFDVELTLRMLIESQPTVRSMAVEIVRRLATEQGAALPLASQPVIELNQPPAHEPGPISLEAMS